MIILKQISLNNFLSHKSTDLTLKEGDKLLIDGASGSGKSSIIDALLWALYGRGRADTRSLIRKGAKECSVSVVLYDTEKEISYQIIRTASSSGKHSVGVLSGKETFQEVGTGGIRDTDAYIAREILGASYELFVNSVVFPQDGAESFISATSVRRKELLLEILKTQDVDEYLTKTKELIAESASIIASKGGSLDASIKLIESYDAKIADLPHLLVREGVLSDDVAKARQALSFAQKEFEETQKSYDSQAADNAALEALYKRIKDVGTPGPMTRTKCEEVIAGEAEVRGALRSAIEHNNELSSAVSDRPQIRDYDSEISAIDRRIRKLVEETIPCPAGDACPYTKMVGPELADLKKERSKKEEDAAQQKLGMKAWEDKVEKMGPRINTTELEDKLRSIDLAHSTLKTLDETDEQTSIKEEVSRLERVLADAPTIKDVHAKRAGLESAKTELSSCESNLARVVGDIRYLETLNSEIIRLKKEVEEVSGEIGKARGRVELLNELREALGSSGVIAVALDYLLPSLEDKINEILGALSDFRVMLSTQKDGVGGKIEGLFISVVNAQGEIMDLNSYSGGERVRVAVAISEALASLQRCGFRIMDEAISALDENMLDSFTGVLTKIQSRYSQLICVSHLPQVKDLFEKRVIIKKVDGISAVM